VHPRPVSVPRRTPGSSFLHSRGPAQAPPDPLPGSRHFRPRRLLGYLTRWLSQFSTSSAISRQPWSMVSEWPRSLNSRRSVIAGDLWYSLRVDRVIAAGTVWSCPPAISSRGPRVLLRVLTLAGDRRDRFAEAASNSGLPGEGQRYRLVPVRRVAQRDRGDPQRRRGQVDHALDRRRVDRHARGREVLAQQSLDDQAAEGVADHDRRGVQAADDLRIVFDHIVDALPGHLVGVTTGLLDGVQGSWPARRRRRVARRLEQFRPRSPRTRVQPQTVNENDMTACWRHRVPPVPGAAARC